MKNNITEDKLLELAFENTEVFENEINLLLSELLLTIDKRKILENSLSLLDITTLHDDDYKKSLVDIVNQGKYFIDNKENTVAGVCIYSNLLPILNKLEVDKRILKVVVSGGFPTGQLSLNAKLSDVSFAMKNGADEVDIPINRGLFFENPNQLKKEIKEIKSVVSQNNKAKLKVIIETSELKTYKNIYFASMLAMNRGADFIKTSTGKVSRGADIYSSVVMILAIKDFIRKNPDRVMGLKVAGGIRTCKQVLQYYSLMQYFFNEKYISKDTFRIGCSNLKQEIINNLNNKIK